MEKIEFSKKKNLKKKKKYNKHINYTAVVVIAIALGRFPNTKIQNVAFHEAQKVLTGKQKPCKNRGSTPQKVTLISLENYSPGALTETYTNLNVRKQKLKTDKKSKNTEKKMLM